LAAEEIRLVEKTFIEQCSVEASTRVNDAPISVIAVNNYNVLMVENSHEQVFSNSEEYLNSIKSVVKRERG